MLRIFWEIEERQKERKKEKENVQFRLRDHLFYFIYMYGWYRNNLNKSAIVSENYTMKYIDYNNVLKLLIVRYVLIKSNLYSEIYDVYNTSHSH